MLDIKNYMEANKERYINKLIEHLKIRSVSTEQALQQEVLNTANSVKDKLEKEDGDLVKICETPGYPLFMEKKLLIKNYQLFWCMDIMMFSLQTH